LVSQHLQKKRRLAAARAKRRRARFLAPTALAAIGIVAVLILAGNFFRGGEQVTTSDVSQRNGRTLGSPAAPVVISAWEDFQCPVCKAANTQVLDRLIAEYVDTGKVQLQYRYFAFLGPESQWAAEAAEAAAEQGRFWEYHDALYNAQAGENRGAFSRERLKAIAEGLGLDMARFEAAFDSGKYRQVVEEEHQEGLDLGVVGTPTYFVNGTPVQDWRDYSAFKRLIDHALGDHLAAH